MSQHTVDPGAGALSLAGIKLLRGIPGDALRSLEEQCVFRRFVAGDVLVARYSDGNAVYFVISGTGRVVHYLPGEDEITIATVSAGDTIGEIAAVDGLGRSATIIADEDCTLAELPRQEFRALVEGHGKVAFALLSHWASIIRELDDKFSYVSTVSPDQRVFSQMVRLSRQVGPDADRWVIREMPSHEELAEWAQTSRESVASAIAELFRRGIAERKNKSIFINDYAALKSMIMHGGRAASADRPEADG
jgi:CRP/FNR family transcriptional regulator, cyclic AMP receptor protein